jgi:hypothetical protein
MDVGTNQVWRPPVERPAGQDFAVGLYLNMYGRTRTLLLRSMFFFAVLAAVNFFVLDTLVGLGVVMVVGLVAQAVRYVHYEMRHGRYYPVVRAMVDTAVPVWAKAEFVGRDVLVVNDGQMHLRLRTTWGVRQLVARSGGLWLVGYQSDIAVVFVDGLPVPLGADVVERPEPSEVDPVGGDVTDWFARRFALSQWIVITVFALLYAGLLADILKDGDATERWVFGTAIVALVVALVIRLLDLLLLPKRLQRGEWHVYPAQMRAWTGNPRLFGSLGVYVTLPDGSYLPVAVRVASAHLVANVQVTGQLWVKGQPEAGKRAVVGVPGYPIAAPARFVRKPKLHG